MSEPASLRWVSLFMDSMNRALDGDVYSWELKEQADPLTWVLVITLIRHVRSEEAHLLREQLRLWADINEARYRRSTWRKHEFRALLLIKGLGPEQNINPYNDDEVDLVVFRRRRSGLWRARRAHPRSSLHPPDQPAQETPDRVLADVLGHGFQGDDGPGEGEAED